ncbi:MAG: hypothetical protein JJT77_13900 [Crocinitomicaceae bacterium]|nr:hypothetical protein [Crocinitomicaceae bacterium]
MRQLLALVYSLLVFTTISAQTDSTSSLGFSNSTYAQEKNWKEDVQLGAVFGLTQPIFVSGFNVEGVFVYKRWIFDYSHGVSLNFRGEALTQELRDQNVEIHMPFTTGFGIGYRFTKWLNLRVEPKWHRFDTYYEGEELSKSNRILRDNTASLGLGLYGFFQPFEKKENALKGITIAPSLRFWPTISSNIDDDGFKYQNKITGNEEVLKTLDSGFGFTPIIFNVSIGYMFGLRNK